MSARRQTKRRTKMNEPDDDGEPELHLWAEFNLPAEVLHLAARRVSPLWRARARRRSSAALARGCKARDEADAESVAPFAVERPGLA
jgi:hypothetical protein